MMPPLEGDLQKLLKKRGQRREMQLDPLGLLLGITLQTRETLCTQISGQGSSSPYRTLPAGFITAKDWKQPRGPGE